MNDVLTAERTHLEDSRQALHAMREAVAGLQVFGGNAVSTEVLKQVLYRRMRALEDDPTVPLFFGRLDYARDLGAELDETLYVGRRHISGELGGDPLVVDWRAPVSRPFYRASPVDPMGVRSRRRFGFSHGRLTAYEDEHLDRGVVGESRLLADEIERPRTGPMRDIVATIQPDQDALVRTDLARSVCIQGAPGTGKTAVGLHRAAYLLYAYRDQLSRSGVMVVGPNESFLSYIRDVLPALGEIDATQETVESMVRSATGVEVTGTEAAPVAVLKGDARLAEVVQRAVWSRLRDASETLVVPRGSWQIRVTTGRQNATVAALRATGVRYTAGRALLAQRLAHEVLLRLEGMGESTDDRVQSAVARTPAVKAAVAALWPALDARAVLFDLLSDREALRVAAEGILSDAEQDVLVWQRPPRTPRTARWTLADVVLLDEIGDLLSRTPSLGHVVLDEAQDLSPMMLRAVGRRASTGSVTVLGDLAQGTTPWAAATWPEALGHLGKPDAELTELTEGFRVPAAVLAYASQLLPLIAPGLVPPRSVRRSPGDLELVTGGLTSVVAAVRRAAGREGSVGLIVADDHVAAITTALSDAAIDHALIAGAPEFVAHVEVVPASLAKGLEFDHVVVLEPAAIVAAEPDELTGLRRLYVCLTRAVTSLTIVHEGPLPPELDVNVPPGVTAARPDSQGPIP
ncbi:MAG: ATP-binding domain-containing protein [Micropruina sp.]|nr:ATP-binding domain-containing protein [Micropruina sp.]